MLREKYDIVLWMGGYYSYVVDYHPPNNRTVWPSSADGSVNASVIVRGISKNPLGFALNIAALDFENNAFWFPR